MATPAVPTFSRLPVRRLALIVTLGALALAYQAHAITDIVRDLRTASGGPRPPFNLEVVAGRIRAALKFIDAKRLIPAPDCGMKYLSRAAAFGKLMALSQGAAIVRKELQ